MRRCPQCGAESPEQAKFCGVCGHALAALQQPVPVAPPEGYETPLDRPYQEYVPMQRPFQPQSFAPSQPDSQRTHYAPQAYPAAPPAFPNGAVQQPPIAQVPQSYPQHYPQNYQDYPQAVYPPQAYGIGPGGLPVGQQPAAQPTKKRRSWLFIVISVLLVLIVASVATVLILVNVNGQPRLEITEGKVSPGQQIVLRGSHYPAGSKISVTLDSTPVASSPRSELGMLAVPQNFSRPEQAYGVVFRATTGSDGSFSIKIRVPTTWKVGSKHTLVAEITSANPQKIKPLQYDLEVVA